MPGWPMVSLPSGAAAAKKSFQRAIPWLQGYEEIVLFFDNDEAGRKATEEAASVLQPGKTKIARLENYKDASDALQANDSEAIRRAIWDAKHYRPDGIVDGKTLLELVTTPTLAAVHDYPFQGIQNKATRDSVRRACLRSLQDRVPENQRSVENSQLTCYAKENGSDTWLLRNPTVVLLSDDVRCCW
jgi:DNA primase